MKILFWFCVAILVLFAATQHNDSARAPGDIATGSISRTTTSAWDEMRNEAIAHLSVKRMEWSKGGFGSVMVVNDLTILNGSRYKVSDLQLSCTVSAESGTVVSGPAKILYISIPPKKSKSLHDVNVGFINDQATGASCWISDVGNVSLIE